MWVKLNLLLNQVKTEDILLFLYFFFSQVLKSYSTLLNKLIKRFSAYYLAVIVFCSFDLIVFHGLLDAFIFESKFQITFWRVYKSSMSDIRDYQH